MKILIVEDDRAVVAMIQRVISPLKAETFVASNWAAAEEALKLMEYHVICLDLGLPDSPTYETLQKISAIKMRHPQTAVMVITGSPMITPEQAEEARADAFIRKNETLFQRGFLIQQISAVFSRICHPERNLKAQVELAKQATQDTIQQIKAGLPPGT